MARLALVALALHLVAAQPNPLIADVRPSADEKQLAIGIASGFISDKQVLMMCVMGAAAEITEFKTSLVVLQEALTTMPINVTKIEEAVDGVEEAAQNIPLLTGACQPLKSAVQDLSRAFGRLHGPGNMMIHMLDHLVEGGDKIFAELAEADKYYKTGQNYIPAGENLGMAFRRMLVGEINGTNAPNTAPVQCREEVFEGMSVGFLSDSLEFAKCSNEFKADDKEVFKAFRKLEEAFWSMKGDQIEAAVEEIDRRVEQAESTRLECKDALKTADQNMHALEKELKALHGPKDLAMHLLNNLLTDHENISGELAKAAEAYKSNKCIDAGRQIGMAARKTLVGETRSAKTEAPVIV